MKTFTTRLTLRFAALVTATTAAVLVAGGLLLDRQHERGLELLHEVEARELLELIGDAPPTPAAIAQRIAHDADSDAALFVIQVSDLRGEVLFRSGNLGATLLPPQPESEPHVTRTLPYLGRVHLSEFVSAPWRIQIGSPLEPAERLLRDYLDLSALLLAGAAVVSLTLGYALSRATLRPVRAIAATARRIRADNLATRIPVPPGRDELADLSQLLNRMLDGLQTSFEQIDRFAADVSHELKTPLALIRLNAEKVRARAVHDPDCESACSDILEQVERLQQLVERLLFLARSGSPALAATFRAVELAPLLESFAADAAALAEDRGVRFVLARNDPGTIRGEPELLRQLLLNLVHNAIAASPDAATVALESVAAPDARLFRIVDEGPGLPPDRIADVFQRFFRTSAAPADADAPAAPGPSPTARPRGHGLGLAICRNIVDLHGGTLELANRPDRSGLVATVVLPAA